MKRTPTIADPGTAIERRLLLRGAGAAGLLATIPSRLLARPKGESLGGIAGRKGILFGASFAAHELDAPHARDYARIYTDDARLLTSELEFKLSSLRPRAGVLDFYGADRIVAFAKERAMAVRAHTLIWNDDVPAWVQALPPGEAEALLVQHIETVMRRYKDAVTYWDVVNEPIAPWDNKPGKLRDGPFYRALGESYVTRAFVIARAIAPGATLVLNEAQCETGDENGETFRAALLDLLRRLRAQGTAPDAVGLQGHLKLNATYDWPRFAGFLDAIADMGFDIHITELDVNDAGGPDAISQRDSAVARLYAEFLAHTLANRSVKVVQTWQLSDATSWMRYAAAAKEKGLHANPRPLPYDTKFRRKKVWDAIAKALDDAPLR